MASTPSARKEELAAATVAEEERVAASVTNLARTEEANDSAIELSNNLHNMIEYAEENNLSEVLSYAPSGKGFTIHNKTEFAKDGGLMKTFFGDIRYKSFRTKMTKWNFKSVEGGGSIVEHITYVHPFFQKDNKQSFYHMTPTPAKRKIWSSNLEGSATNTVATGSGCHESLEALPDVSGIPSRINPVSPDTERAPPHKRQRVTPEPTSTTGASAIAAIAAAATTPATSAATAIHPRQNLTSTKTAKWHKKRFLKNKKKGDTVFIHARQRHDGVWMYGFKSFEAKLLQNASRRCHAKGCSVLRETIKVVTGDKVLKVNVNDVYEDISSIPRQKRKTDATTAEAPPLESTTTAAAVTTATTTAQLLRTFSESESSSQQVSTTLGRQRVSAPSDNMNFTIRSIEDPTGGGNSHSISTLDDTILQMAQRAEEFQSGISSISRERSEEVKRLKASHKEEVGKLNQQVQNLKEELDKRSKERDFARAEVDHIRSRHEKQTWQVRDQHEDERKKMISDYEAVSDQLNKLRQEYSKSTEDLEAVRKERASALAEVAREISTAYSDDLNKLRNNHKNEVDYLRNRQDDDLNAIQNSHKQELDNLRSDQSKVIEQHRNEHAILRADHTKTMDELVVVRNELDTIRSEKKELEAAAEALFSPKPESIDIHTDMDSLQNLSDAERIIAQLKSDRDSAQAERDSARADAAKGHAQNVEISTELNEWILNYNTIVSERDDLRAKLYGHAEEV